jgi:hypothetical protein
MNFVKEANESARKTSRFIANVIRRDGKRVTDIVKLLSNASLNIVGVSIDRVSYNINVSGSRAELDILFGILRRAGLTPLRRPEEGQPSYSTYWYFDAVGGEDLLVTDKPCIWVNFSSTSCKRVKVGTRLEEVDVYETVCEE